MLYFVVVTNNIEKRAGDVMSKKVMETGFWLCYLSPFRLITHDDEKIDITLDEINSLSYNHALLCRIISEISYPFRGVNVNLGVCGDGALFIKNETECFSVNDIILLFNDFMCKLAIGGIDAEGITTKDVTRGFIHENSHIWPVNFGYSNSSHMHGRLRMKLANQMETIYLDGACKNSITITTLNDAVSRGNEILKCVTNLNTFYLISGITELKYGNWSSALLNLWIIAEQITDFLWNNRFLSDSSRNPNIPSRMKTLKQDHRTYSASVKQEILFQLDIIPLCSYEQLFSVRKARNKFLHEGIMIDKNTVVALYQALCKLIPIAANLESIPFFEKDIGTLFTSDIDCFS